MRILIVTHYFSAHGGGIEMVASRLASQFAGDGHDVTWAASATDATDQDAAQGIRCLPMRCWNAVERRMGIPFPVWSPGALRQLWRSIGAAEVAVFHDVLYVPNLLGMVMCVLRQRPYLLVQHVGQVPFRSRGLRAIMALGNRTVGILALRKAAASVFISDTVRQYFARLNGCTPRQWHLIPNGVDTARFRAGTVPVPRNDRPRMLFVGRFVEKKGLPLLRRLAEAMPQVEWIFAGWGPMDPGAWKLSNVHVVGRVPHSELSEWYRKADLLVLPSVGEGFPLVVQEAMACGLPVAVSSETAHALPEVATLVHHVPLVQQEEADLAAWRAMIESFLASDGRADERLRVERFARDRWSWSRCARQHVQLMEQACSGAR